MNLEYKFKKIRSLGINLFFGTTFFLFIYSIGSAFNLFALLGLDSFKNLLYRFLSFSLLISFILIFIGSKFEKKHERFEKINTQLLKENGIDQKYFEHQLQFIEPHEQGHNQTKKFFGISILVYGINIIIFIIDTGYIRDHSEPNADLGILKSGIYIYSFALVMISLAFLIAMVAGNFTEDTMRTYFKGYHVHESFMGIYFIFIGIPLMATSSFNYSPFAMGCGFLVAGAFLIGRDWRDIVKGDILVNKNDEKDYKTYLKLKKNKEKLLYSEKNEQNDQ